MITPTGPLALTTAEEPFVRTMAEDPDDDVARLVYADWLEDQGDPYGELIRAQVRLEKMAAKDPNRPALEQRLRELEHAVALAGWKSHLSAHGFEVRSRRGFVDELVFHLHACALPLSGSFTARLARGMVELLLPASCRFTALLRTLRISGDSGDANYGSEKAFRLPPSVADDLLALPCFANLHTLAIDSGGSVILGAETFRVIVCHVNLGRLRKLVLFDQCVGEEGGRSLADSPRLAQLTSLNLCRADVDSDGARALAGSAHLASLTELDLRYNRIDDEGARALADSPYLLALRRLKVHGNLITPQGAAALKARFGSACLLPRLRGSGQPRPGDWYCVECSASKFASREVCHECRSPKPAPLLREGDWVCPGCNAHNFARRQTCHRCKGTRPS